MSITLVIGNKNYSSWSLRSWLALAESGVAFDEMRIPLSRPETTQQILQYSPTGRVPCLLDGPLTVWDSLAICEYVNEQHAGGRLWPPDARRRAQARSVSAEMHSGFTALRTHMSMDIRAHSPERGQSARQRDDVVADIARVQSIWDGCLTASGGPFLFGGFCIADAYYAPVVTRFRTYDVGLPSELDAYAQRVLGLPSMQRWVAAAREESEVITY